MNIGGLLGTCCLRAINAVDIYSALCSLFRWKKFPLCAEGLVILTTTLSTCYRIKVVEVLKI